MIFCSVTNQRFTFKKHMFSYLPCKFHIQNTYSLLENEISCAPKPTGKSKLPTGIMKKISLSINRQRITPRISDREIEICLPVFYFPVGFVVSLTVPSTQENCLQLGLRTFQARRGISRLPPGKTFFCRVSSPLKKSIFFCRPLGNSVIVLTVRTIHLHVF
jgi:hypothetical protein